MPYIITTRSPRPVPEDWIGGAVPGIATRTAVATLEEARATVKRAVNAKGDTRQRFEAHHLPESGKTIGPLPDGTVIEVRLITLTELSLAAGLPMTRELHAALRDEDATPIIAAFNGDRSTA